MQNTMALFSSASAFSAILSCRSMSSSEKSRKKMSSACSGQRGAGDALCLRRSSTESSSTVRAAPEEDAASPLGIEEAGCADMRRRLLGWGCCGVDEGCAGMKRLRVVEAVSSGGVRALVLVMLVRGGMVVEVGRGAARAFCAGMVLRGEGRGAGVGCW